MIAPSENASSADFLLAREAFREADPEGNLEKIPSHNFARSAQRILVEFCHLGQNLLDHVSVYIGKAKIPPLKLIGEPLVVHAE